MGIGRLRWWCEKYGLRVDLSDILKKKMVVFTTPPAGSFKFIMEYKGRAIEISLYGRDLYTMGFRVLAETFEMRSNLCKRTKNFMSGQSVTILQFKKNYNVIAPHGDVRHVRLGLFSLMEAFEVLYKCSGETETSHVRNAIATFAVHLAEAGRLQSILKYTCQISAEGSMETLDSRSDNSLWVNDYNNYGGQVMTRIARLKQGKTLPEIIPCENHDVTEVKILNQIGIFPRDACK